MSDGFSKASWVGTAAHEIINQLGWSGTRAATTARELAEELLDYGIELGSIEPRTYARQHFGLHPQNAALRTVLGDGAAVSARIQVYVEENVDYVEILIAGPDGKYCDAVLSWCFVNAIVEAYHGRSWDTGQGSWIKPVKSYVIVQIRPSAVRQGVTLAFTREQALAFGNGVMEAVETAGTVDLGEIDSSWGTGDVLARLAA